MGSRRARRTIILRAGIATLLLGTTLAITVIAMAPASAEAPNAFQVEICHATGAVDNPYTTPNPNKWQITSPNGHAWDEGDIIPPFDAGAHGNQTWPAFPGLNWDGNEDFHAAGCGEPETGPQTGVVTLAKVLAGVGIPSPVPTGFDFTVQCDSGTVADPMPTIAPGAVAVTVATGVELDDTCTITETDVPANAAVTFSTGTPGTDSTTVTVDSTDGVAVTATNTYPGSNSPGCTVDCGGPNPTAVLTASRSCGTGGILIAVSNAGAAAGAANIVSGVDQPFSHGLHVLPGATDAVLVPIAEGSDYLITVTDVAGAEVATFRGPRDCEDVGGVVVRPTTPVGPVPVVTPVGPAPVVQPVSARPVEVAGLVRTRQLPRTGTDSLPLAQLGVGLVLVGAAATVASRRNPLV